MSLTWENIGNTNSGNVPVLAGGTNTLDEPATKLNTALTSLKTWQDAPTMTANLDMSGYAMTNVADVYIGSGTNGIPLSQAMASKILGTISGVLDGGVAGNSVSLDVHFPAGAISVNDQMELVCFALSDSCTALLTSQADIATFDIKDYGAIYTGTNYKTTDRVRMYFSPFDVNLVPGVFLWAQDDIQYGRDPMSSAWNPATGSNTLSLSINVSASNTCNYFAQLRLL